MEDHKNKLDLPVKQSGQKKAHDNEAASRAEDSKEELSLPSSKLSPTVLENIESMKKEFEKKRKILVQNVSVGDPDSNNKLMATIIGSEDFKIVYNSKESCFRMIFPDAKSASSAISKINNYKNSKMAAQYGHPDSMLFVGNLPLSYDKNQLKELFSPHGKILRCFVVYSVLSGESKGYGFIEYSTREEATATKTNMATKLVGSRTLRVDFADNGMQTVEDLQSKTIFIDKLPKGMKNESRLVDLISKYGTVNFCQIALLPNGCPRGFAFVDMSSSVEAEAVQLHCNGSKLDGQEIRVSYGMPCRPGACILHPRHNNGTHAAWNNKMIPHNIVGPYCNGNGTSVMPGLVINNEPIITYTSRDSGIHHIGPPFYPFVSFNHPLPLQDSLVNKPPSYNRRPYTSNSYHSDITTNDYHSDTTSITTNGYHSDPSTNGYHSDTSTNDFHSDAASNGSTSDIDKENHEPRKQIVTGQKRRLQEDQDDLMAVYDKPYIGQHDQGIQYQHPLKRIKKS